MSLELWNTIFAAGTFVVISATAIAAVIQLRHLRSSNQLAAHLSLMQQWNDSELSRHFGYVHSELPNKVKDPLFLAAIAAGETTRANHPEFIVADFWEQTGALMKYGLLDERAWLDLASAQIVRSWDEMAPVMEALRRRAGPSAYENFEYAAVRSELWARRSPDGYYPRGVPRMAQLRAEEQRANEVAR